MSTTADLAMLGLSNASLTDVELRTVRQLKLAAEMEILRLNGDIEKLLKQKWDLLNTVNQCNVALAHHKRLPLEVLRSIIAFAASEPARIPVVNEGVYAMSQVCSTWRQLILETPELWSNISLDFRRCSSEEADKKIRTAREWLSRAQNRPVSFTINGAEYDVVKKLVEHYPCRALDLSVSYWHTNAQQPQPLGNTSLAALETLDLRGSSLPKFLGEGFSLPVLKSLSVNEIEDLNVIHSVASQLHYLRIRCPTSRSQVLDLMRLCVQLEDCELNIAPDAKNSKSPKSESKRRAVVIPSLRELKLTFHKGANAPSFLQYLKFSNLSSLSLLVESGTDSSPLDPPTISSLIARSDGMPRLQSLTIGEMKEPFDLKALLLDTPSLRQLDIKQGVLDADCMDQLSRGDLGAQLRHLTSRHAHEAEAVLRMVESRHQNATTCQLNVIAPFSSVRVNGVAADTSASLALRDRIRKLRSLGIVVALSI